jgi:hypothetical protein
MTVEIAEVLDIEVVLGKVLDVAHLPFKLDGGKGVSWWSSWTLRGSMRLVYKWALPKVWMNSLALRPENNSTKKVFESAIVVIIVKIRRKIVLVVLVHQMLLVLKSKNCHNRIILKRNSIHKT